MGNDQTRPKPPPLPLRRLPFRSVLPTEGLELAKHDSCGSRTLSNTPKNLQVDQHFYRDYSIVNQLFQICLFYG